MTVWVLLLWGLLLILLLLLHKLILIYIDCPFVVTLLSKLPLPKKSTKPSRNQPKKAKRRARKAHITANVNPKTNKFGYLGVQTLGNRRHRRSPIGQPLKYTYLVHEEETICHPLDDISPKGDHIEEEPICHPLDYTYPTDEEEPICHPLDNISPKGDHTEEEPIYHPPHNNNSKASIQRAGLFRPELHGMDNYEKELMEFLEHGTTPLMGIVGMHGVGKTTLLKLMRTYYSQLSYFRYIFFVEAGKDFTIDMLSGIVSRDIGFGPIPVVNHISSFLRNQSFLLLLDDLQYAVDLADAGLPMKLSSQQKIVFTTRDETVLAEMGCAGNIFRMNCLDEVTAWNLFMYLVGDKIINSHPYIKDLARKIVAECHGIPGVLCTLGGLMSTKKNLEPWIVAHEMLVKAQSSCEIDETENEGYPCLQCLIDEI